MAPVWGVGLGLLAFRLVDSARFRLDEMSHRNVIAPEVSLTNQVNASDYIRLLERKGCVYTIGSGGDGCIGSYPAVLRTCQDRASELLRKMDAAYSQNEFPVAPWHPAVKNNARIVLYENEDVASRMDKLFTGGVSGVREGAGWGEEVKFMEVFSLFRNHKCMALVWGGEIRDAILAAVAKEEMSTMDTDVGWFCNQNTIKAIVAEQEWGGYYDDVSGCVNATPGLKCDAVEYPSSWVLLGDPASRDQGFEGMVASDNVLAPSKTREFSANAVAYDPIFRVILDTTGEGVRDAVRKRVSFAGLEEARALNNSLSVFARLYQWKIAGDPEKMYRLLKLIIPPKSFCIEPMTFKIINYHILNDWESFVEGIKHVVGQYKTRADSMLRYAVKMVYLHGALYGNQTELWPGFQRMQDEITSIYTGLEKAVPADVSEMFDVTDPTALDQSIVCSDA